MRIGNEDYNREMFTRIVRAIEIAGRLGCEAIVVHPIALPEGGEAQTQLNLDFYGRLEPVLRDAGLRCAVENMFGFDPAVGIVPNVVSFSRELADFVDRLDPAHFTVCLDVGHSGLVGETAQDAIRTLGAERLTTLHIHDNDLRSDRHQFPYFGRIEWDEVMRALAEIGYRGHFTLEADGGMLAHPPELLPVSMVYLETIGRQLIARYEGFRGA